MLAGLILSFSRRNCCCPSVDAPSCSKSDNLMAGSSKFPITKFHSLHCEAGYEVGKCQGLSSNNSFTAGFRLEKAARGLLPKPVLTAALAAAPGQAAHRTAQPSSEHPSNYNLHVAFPSLERSRAALAAVAQGCSLQGCRHLSGKREESCCCALLLVGTQVVTWPLPETNKRGTC